MLDPKSVAAHKPLTLRRNFSWTLVGNVVFAACQWGMLVILTRLSSPEVVGQFALGLAITAPVIFFFNLTLRTVQATDTKPEYMFGEYLGLRLITTTLALVTIVGIVLTAGYRWETALIILALGLAKATEAISDVIYGLLQQHERMDRIAVSMTIRGVSSLVAFGAGVYLTGSILWGLLGLITAWLLALLGYDVRSAVLVRQTSLYSRFSAGVVNWKSTLRPCWKPKTLAKLAWITLPLGLAYSIGSLNVNVPRYFIEYYLSERDLGFFAAMAYLLVAGNLIINALGQSATPRLARYYTNREDTAFYTLLLKLIGFAVLLGTIGVLIAFVGGQQILLYLYGPEYAEYPRVLVWI